MGYRTEAYHDQAMRVEEAAKLTQKRIDKARRKQQDRQAGRGRGKKRCASKSASTEVTPLPTPAQSRDVSPPATVFSPKLAIMDGALAPEWISNLSEQQRTALQRSLVPEHGLDDALEEAKWLFGLTDTQVQEAVVCFSRQPKQGLTLQKNVSNAAPKNLQDLFAK